MHNRNHSQHVRPISSQYEHRKRKGSDVTIGDTKKKLSTNATSHRTSHRDEKSANDSSRKPSSPAPDISKKSEFDDARLFCDDCNKFYENICPSHKQPYIPDRKVSKSSLKSTHRRVKLTCPEGIVIKTSTLPEAGQGVFAKKRFDKHTYFGPYMGTRHSDFKSAQQSGYAWSIADKFGEIAYLIDGCHPNNSNWMRFVNCPNTIGQQNLQPVQYDRNMFYKTMRTISPGEELFVYYGDEYARYLGVKPFGLDNDNNDDHQ